MAQKGSWSLVREKVLLRKNKAVYFHYSFFLVFPFFPQPTAQEIFFMLWETKEETSQERMREEEKEEIETVSAERCVGSVSAETFDIFSQRENSESCGVVSWGLLKNPENLSDCEPETRTDVSAVPDVTVVPISASSVVTEAF